MFGSSSQHSTPGKVLHLELETKSYEADLIVVCTRDADNAINNLEKIGEDVRNVFLFYINGYEGAFSKDFYKNEKMRENLGLRIGQPSICNMFLHQGSKINFDPFDWVRNQCWRLAAERIQKDNITGAVAELGVYRGDQAQFISNLFPQNKFFLFDTFEGFNQEDVDNPFEESISMESEFKNTSIEMVLEKITNPDRVILKKGLFPDTAKGIDESFLFVSLDVDLYSPTKSGLDFFYERLVEGGVIFVHDYNNMRYPGVKKAVTGFLKETKAASFEIPDNAGSICILK